MTVVVGVDLSSTAISLVRLDDDDTAEHTLVELPGTDSFARARMIRPLMPGASWWDDVALCGVEETYSVSYRAAVALGRAQGAVLASIPQGVAVVPTPPNEWQRLLLGLDGPLPRDRRQRKTEIRRRVIELGFGDAPDTPQDAYDAYGVAYCVRALCEKAAAA